MLSEGLGPGSAQERVRGTVAEVTAGELRPRFAAPLDWCSDCGRLFADWMRAGKPDQVGEIEPRRAPSSCPVGSTC